MPIERRVLDYDAAAGMREDYVFDHADDKARIVLSQDVQPILNEAARLRSEAPGWKGDFVSVAKLSLLQCIELMKLGIMSKGFAIRDEVAFGVWLKEHNKLKTTEGRF